MPAIFEMGRFGKKLNLLLIPLEAYLYPPIVNFFLKKCHFFYERVLLAYECIWTHE
jgi:hypothetical protein